MADATVHASAVAVGGLGCLICGRPGAGKSTLALQMIAQGADLIADDQTMLTRQGSAVSLSAPPALSGRIEARGVGLLRVPAVKAPLTLIVDLDRAEASRLPARRYHHLLGLACPIILGRGRNGLAAILRVALLHGTEGTEWLTPSA